MCVCVCVFVGGGGGPYLQSGGARTTKWLQYTLGSHKRLNGSKTACEVCPKRAVYQPFREASGMTFGRLSDDAVMSDLKVCSAPMRDFEDVMTRGCQI